MGKLCNLWTALSEGIRDDALLHVPGSRAPAIRHRDLLAAAERTAGQIVEALDGRPARRLGLLFPNGEPFVRGALATWRLGATAVPLPLPVAFGGASAYLEHLRRIAVDASLDAVLVGGEVARLMSRLPDALGATRLLDVTEPALAAPPEVAGRVEELAVIQYTSGSTSRPKGVMLTHDNVAAGLSAMAKAVGWTADDTAGIWLPLFHDMGLFSLTLALTRGSTTWLWQPADFVRRPMKWLGEFARAGATGVPGPNFFYDLLLSAAESDGIPADLDLSRWRLGINGAEPVQRRTIEEFQEKFAPHGLRPGVIQPTYGMAEATLMVTFAAPFRELRSLNIDRDRLSTGQRVRFRPPSDERSRVLVSCGSPVEVVAVRICDESGAPLPDGTVGEIQIDGPAVTSGYLNLPADHQPVTPDGWLRTGDLGLLHDGELYITGRLKDVIIVAGHNYYAEDVEHIVRTTPGVRKRRTVAFAAGDAERMVVLWETRAAPAEAAQLSEEIRRRLVEQLGLHAVELVAVPTATIPFTSSGKVKRHAALALWQKNRIPPAHQTAAVMEGARQ